MNAHVVSGRLVWRRRKVKLFYYVEEDAAVIQIIAESGAERGSNPGF
jgi:hypothetical protein